MGNEHGEWILYGVADNDPYCLHSIDELLDYIDELGFLPLFKNDVPGFSVEERTVPYYWWSGNEKRDPWEWRTQAAASHRVAYGKFFAKKAGFISLKWLPYFANWRRNGYDFDSLCDDGLASYRKQKIMNLFLDEQALFSFQAKRMAGFGKDGDKNFDGIVTELQMQMYLVINEFRRRRNKAGDEYGWSIAVLSTPESIWGYDVLSSSYGESPEESKERIYKHLKELCPIATEKQIDSILKY